VIPDPRGQDRLWDYYQNEAPEKFFFGTGARLAWLVGRVRGRRRVLDIGVGDGLFERLAVRAGHEVSCLDPSPDSVARVRDDLGLGARAHVGRAESMPFPDASFDAVVASEVLEHLADAELAGAVAEIARVLAPGGLLVGTVPAAEQLTEQTVVCPCCGERFHRWGHQQSFDAGRLRAVLGRDLAVGRIEERIFVDWGALNWKGKVSGALRLGAHRVGLMAHGDHLAFEAVRAGR
jgi:SAM-dependent methyltransferase